MEPEGSARGWNGGLWVCSGSVSWLMSTLALFLWTAAAVTDKPSDLWASCLLSKFLARSTAMAPKLRPPKLDCPIRSVGYHCCWGAQESIS